MSIPRVGLETYDPQIIFVDTASSVKREEKRREEKRRSEWKEKKKGKKKEKAKELGYSEVLTIFCIPKSIVSTRHKGLIHLPVAMHVSSGHRLVEEP